MATRKGPVTIREMAAALAALPAEMQDQPLVVIPDTGNPEEAFTVARSSDRGQPVDLVRGALRLTNAMATKGEFRENAVPASGEEWGAAVWLAFSY